MDLGNGEKATRKRRRHKGSTVRGGSVIGVDRISSLPEAIIFYILSLLPTKSAVVASFLSKSWKFRWTQIDDRQWPSRVSESEMGFHKFVDLVFANHTESIRNLRLRCDHHNAGRQLDRWLDAAVARNIRHLNLATPDSSRPMHDVMHRRLTTLVAAFFRSQLSHLFDLINHSDNLQVLDIVLVHEEGEKVDVDTESVPRCFSSSLKCLYFRSFSGRDDEMALLEFILDHCLLIEKVNLYYDDEYDGPNDDTNKLYILNKVSMWPKVSATCKILLMDE